MKPSARILAVDMGGTNTNIGYMEYHDGVWGIRQRWKFASQEINNVADVLSTVVREIQDTFRDQVADIVLGAAGVVFFTEQDAQVRVTNLATHIDSCDLQNRLAIKRVWVINDFELVAYGVDHMLPAQYHQITKVPLNAALPRACIGAGTGLGTVYMAHQVILASEGGHCAASAPRTAREAEIMHAMADILAVSYVTYEDILAGRGLKAVYQALRRLYSYPETDVTRLIAQAGFKPDDITQYAHQDPACSDTLEWYQIWYARYAQAVALQGLTIGGLYIAGGIITHNPGLVGSDLFLKTFVDHERHHDLLKQVPLVVILDYDISLYGAAWYYAKVTQST